MTSSDFQIKDYELKISYLKDHLARMWNRFNYMLAIQTAIAGGKFFVNPDKIEFCIIGVIFAIFWFALGAQDRYLFKFYQKQVSIAFNYIDPELAPKDKSYVGQVDEAPEKIERDFFTWRFKAISSTKMAAIVPLLIAILWSLCFFFQFWELNINS